jgi:predicted enzyme related to lactoylglutathione lyase
MLVGRTVFPETQERRSLMNPTEITAVLPAENLERAKAFYTEKIGLSVAPMDIPGGLMLGEGKSRLFVYQAGAKSPGTFTQAGIEVPSARAAVEELQGRGVVFEEYDMPEIKTENGIAKTPGGETAWFKDTEGNIVSLVEPISQ